MELFFYMASQFENGGALRLRELRFRFLTLSCSRSSRLVSSIQGDEWFACFIRLPGRSEAGMYAHQLAAMVRRNCFRVSSTLGLWDANLFHIVVHP